MSEFLAELEHRLELFDRAQKLSSWPLLTAAEVRELGIYGGASGVWVDKVRTKSLATNGVAVGLLHTGRHYDDDIDETGVLYHYPTTERSPARDSNEISAIKNAAHLHIPVFVIRNVGQRKRIDLAWLRDFDDDLRICVLTFDTSPNFLEPPTSQPEETLFGHRRTQKNEIVRAERDPLFKFNILKRFNGACIATGLNVTEMLDAAHIVPVARGGTEAPRNGLLLSASAHRAFDAHLWTIHPATLQIVTHPKGPSAARMKISNIDLYAQRNLLDHEALEYRYQELFLKRASA